MQHYDIAILGGGISGLGLAVEASARGISTLLLEATQCCRGTSDNTLRIIHGGFRYLQHAHLTRVIRSLLDQTRAFSHHPSAMRPLPCLMPLRRFGLKSRLPVTAAALAYGAMMKATRSPLPTPRVLSPSSTHELAPIMREHTAHGALCWHDVVMTDPAAVANSLFSTAIAHGASLRENTHVTKVHQEDSGFVITTASHETLRATTVVNALGPWLDTIEVPKHLRGFRPKWCKGFNITISRQLHPTHALALQSREGRLFFCVPRGPHTTIGTWYTPLSTPSLAHIAQRANVLEATESELREFILSLNAAFPEANVTREEIIGIDTGVLPMKHDSPSGPILYGSELVHHKDRYCEIVSTKYTTFYSQARCVLRTLGM